MPQFGSVVKVLLLYGTLNVVLIDVPHINSWITVLWEMGNWETLLWHTLLLEPPIIFLLHI
jgi:hypothetical protein